MFAHKMKPQAKATTSFKSRIHHIWDNKDGVAAIEFAIIAPVMIALYLGLAEISLLISADRTVSHSASVTGDLATQEESLTTSDIEDIFNASLAVLGTNFTNSQRVSIDIRSFQIDSSGDLQEVGYAKLGTGITDKFDATGTSTVLLNQTSGLVVTRVQYEYYSPSRTYVQTPTLSETFMLKPRQSVSIPFDSNISCTVISTGNGVRASC